jgi:uncharacterized protein (TIGR03086 family)
LQHHQDGHESVGAHADIFSPNRTEGGLFGDDTGHMTTNTNQHPSDPRPLLAKAIEIATPIVAGVQPDQLALPTPCTEYDVSGLLGHLLFAVDRLAMIGRGEPGAFADEEHLAAGNGDWLAGWKVGAAEAQAAWADDAALTREVVAPWATMPGAAMLATYINELTVHPWDLATATGQQVAWDDSVCALALSAMRQALPMADRTPMWEAFKANMPTGMEMTPPFANATDVPADAPMIDQVVAWSGRRP